MPQPNPIELIANPGHRNAQKRDGDENGPQTEPGRFHPPIIPRLGWGAMKNPAAVVIVGVLAHSLKIIALRLGRMLCYRGLKELNPNEPSALMKNFFRDKNLILRRRLFIGILLGLCLKCLCWPVKTDASTPGVDDQIRVVALVGQHAPGFSSTSNFDFLQAPSINIFGNTAFTGTAPIAGPDFGGIWYEGNGVLQLAARTSTQALGTSSGVLWGSFFSAPAQDNFGDLAFIAQLSGTGVTANNNLGIWVDRNTSVQFVARTGGPAIGTSSGVVFGSTMSQPMINGSGQAAFYASLSGSGVQSGVNDQGLWAQQNNSLQLVARSGDPAPGTSPGIVFQSLFSTSSTPFPPLFATSGQAAFTAHLSGPGVNQGGNDVGIWVGQPGNISLVARQGDQAMGLAAGVNYNSIGPFALNDSGQVAFAAQTTFGPGAGVWEGAPGSLRVAASAGTSVPGTASGVNFTGFGEDTINASGKVAFSAGVSGPGVVSGANDGGIWSEGLGQLNLVARKGDKAPGTPAGVAFSTFFSPILNADGQTAFYGRLTGPGVNSTNNEGIWAQDLSGQLHLIARDGDMLELSPTDFRQITQILVPTGYERSPGGLSGLNDAGQFAFYAKFNGANAGVFVSNVVAVPEPASAVLFAVGIVAAGLSRKTRSIWQQR